MQVQQMHPKAANKFLLLSAIVEFNASAGISTPQTCCFVTIIITKNKLTSIFYIILKLQIKANIKKWNVKREK
jgi:hypothetical protein